MEKTIYEDEQRIHYSDESTGSILKQCVIKEDRLEIATIMFSHKSRKVELNTQMVFLLVS